LDLVLVGVVCGVVLRVRIITTNQIYRHNTHTVSKMQFVLQLDYSFNAMQRSFISEVRYSDYSDLVVVLALAGAALRWYIRAWFHGHHHLPPKEQNRC